ncbi:MAG: Vitamin B12 dependent methionine synthase activation subunit [Ruminococcaceae bacterium]|nr:Vitamin B12 dependent methionine synthase activation subunit [Oscillospiraceae bacterium]
MAIIRAVTKSFPPPPVDTDEILRYAGCRRGGDEVIRSLLDEVTKEAEGLLTYKVCYLISDITVTDDGIYMGEEFFPSRSLAKTLQGSDKAVLFGATVGIALDRLIMRYSKLSPAKAVLLQGFGAERIEALCDEFCSFLQSEYKDNKFTSRFSPGYGDLDIKNQKTIFDLLNAEKNIGLFLNESMLMTPSKSVTAFAGISI